jgi:hypothetical protein
VNSLLSEILKNLGIPLALCVISFALGRYTMRSAVEKEAEQRYSEQYKESVARSEVAYAQRLRDETESLRKQLDLATSKVVETDKTTVTKKDGTVEVREHTKVAEETKKKETVSDYKKTVEVTKEVESKKETDKKEGKVEETTKVVEKVVPPPSWRVYAAAAVQSPLAKRESAYGAGGMYDFGPVSGGVFGLRGAASGDVTLGLTLGISF